MADAVASHIRDWSAPDPSSQQPGLHDADRGHDAASLDSDPDRVADRLVGLMRIDATTIEGQRLTLAYALARNLVKLAPWQLAHMAVFRMAAGSQQARWPVLAAAAQVMVGRPRVFRTLI
jgi:hypothetical protein